MALMTKQGRFKEEYQIGINFNHVYKAAGDSMKSGSWLSNVEVANILKFIEVRYKPL